MRIVSLLILWCLSLVLAVWHGHSTPHHSAGKSLRARRHGTPPVLKRTRNAGLPAPPARRNPSLHIQDGQDSDEDETASYALLLSETLDVHRPGWSSSFARVRFDLRRIPSLPHPLRC